MQLDPDQNGILGNANGDQVINILDMLTVRNALGMFQQMPNDE